MLLSFFRHFVSFSYHASAIAAFLLFFSVLQISASPSDISVNFSQLSVKNGLSQNTVYAMVQDQQGFMWIATEDGLNRFDGEKFVHYRHSANNRHSIADNLIRKVFVDKSNTLWVGTQNGLSRYNAKQDNFDNYLANTEDNHALLDNIIWDIYQDNKNNIFISTGTGLHSYNTQQDDFDRIRIQGSDQKLTEINTLYQDYNQNYWIASYENGISIANSNFSSLISLQHDNAWDLRIEASILYDFITIDDQYWLATDEGVYVISSDYQLVRHYHQNAAQNPLLSNQVRAMETVDDSQLWLGTDKGLNSLNLLNDEITAYQQSDAENNALSKNGIMDIYSDDANVIWVGTYGGGINKHHPSLAKFKQRFHGDNNRRVFAFAETADQKVWFSTGQGGLYQILANQEIISFPVKFDDIISQVFAISNDELLLRLDKGQLFHLAIKTNQLTEHKSFLSEARESVNRGLMRLDSNLWFIDTDGLLSSYNIVQQSFKRYAVASDVALTSLYIEDQQHIWATGNNNALYVFNPLTQSFEQVLINTNEQFNLAQTSSLVVNNQWVWLGSDSIGAALINKESNEVNVFNESGQLSNNFIANILIDEQNNAWLGTNKGLSVINPNDVTVRNFEQIFSSSENEFISFSALKASSGELYLGSANGFYQVDPSEILAISQNVRSPFLTDVFLANKKVQVQATATQTNKQAVNSFVLPRQVNYIENLQLNYNQFPFSLEFVSANSKFPAQLAYRYRLSGLENDWIVADTQFQRATYTKLNPGSYVFELQAYDLHDLSSVKTKTLEIQVLPPWWLTNLALACYALLIFTFIAYIVHQIKQRHYFHQKIKVSEQRLKYSLWGSGDEMWDWNIITGKIFRTNILGVLDFPLDGKRNKTAKHTNIHPLDTHRVTAALDAHLDKICEHFEASYRVKSKDGKWIWILDRGRIVERDHNDKPTRMTGTLKNISHIKETQERLRLFARCFESISDALVIYDQYFTIVDVNKAYQKITGISRQQALGAALEFAQYPLSYTADVKAQLLAKGSWHDEIQSCRADNSLYLVDLNIDVIFDENKRISHYVGVFSDITARKQTEAELLTLANADTLTGLPNRSYFQTNQVQLVNNKIPHALLVFDLDNFKKINDSLGHQMGDVLLCKVAERLASIKNNSDTIYRLGGDEFSLILENITDCHAITTTANKMLHEISLPMQLKNQEVALFASVGIALYPDDGDSPQELLKNADTAMYHAKNLGGNKCQFFSDSMNKQAVSRLKIESMLRHGLKKDLFSVFYQPKIEISTGNIAGMEALVRFETPSKGLISPAVFIPVSEETGQIIAIGEIVLRKACLATKKWVDAGLFDGRVAVNLSAVQFTQPNLVPMISQILQQSQLPAKYLELEITEGTVMNEPQQAIDTMLQLRAMGIHLALDDFGTGYSSLAYLKKFPLNTLKIDKAFVDDIEHSEKGRNMVATIVTIAHNLEMQVVAEGVETSPQMDFLATLNCEQLQGYLYSKPLCVRNFENYLRAFQIIDKSTLLEKS